LFEVYSEWADVAPVPCPVSAGGALFHNRLTFHGLAPTWPRPNGLGNLGARDVD